MFVPFDPGLDWAAYDYVIVGAGPAGLFLAEKFAPRGKVLILEAGGRDLSQAQGEGYYDIEVTGRPIGSLGRRLSVFGGTSNHWGGHSHPLSPLVFANRPGFPGWPIAYSDYALHLDEAQGWLNLGPFPSKTTPTGIERDLLGRTQNLAALHFQFSNPLRHFGDAPTQARYAELAGIDIVLDTRVTDIRLDAGGTRVESLDVFHLPSARTATVPVKLLFLATGGIENPRLLLWSARKYAAGNPLAGGPNALTGKYFMEHPSLSPAEIYIDGRTDISALAQHADGSRMVNVVLRPTDEFLAKHELTRFAMHFQENPQPATTDVEIVTAADYFVTQSPSYVRIMPFFIFEQTPDPQSYVTLSQKRGADGTPLARLNWYISDEEVARYRRGIQLFCGLLNQHGLAKTRFVGDAAGPDWSKLQFGDAAHHMGTTRMAHAASGGVVDANLQVFGLSNMFVTGASVFPTTDIVNPTLNLMALTARLAHFVLARAETAVGGIYRFGKGRDADKALGTGWAVPEFAGVWSDGDVASLKLDRRGATTLTFQAGAAGTAQVEVQVNGASVYSGPANGLSGKPLPAGSEETLALELHFSQLDPATDASGNAGRRGVFLQTVTLK
ncbi:MAG TPA: GMC oxidoreductase [Devosiaceae bacterium]|jgi:choline dehydrogenase-like flavoprotein|nr:GMC oxidoreductase [Devosiaceae bacterium]